MDFTALDKMVLSQYSSIEKKCIYRVVFASMTIDDESDAKELRILEKIADILGLSQEERDTSERLPDPTIVETIQEMSEVKRAYVARFLAEMILADGKVTGSEQDFFHVLLEHLNLPNE